MDKAEAKAKRERIDGQIGCWATIALAVAAVLYGTYAVYNYYHDLKIGDEVVAKAYIMDYARNMDYQTRVALAMRISGEHDKDALHELGGFMKDISAAEQNH